MLLNFCGVILQYPCWHPVSWALIAPSELGSLLRSYLIRLSGVSWGKMGTGTLTSTTGFSSYLQCPVYGWLLVSQALPLQLTRTKLTALVILFCLNIQHLNVYSVNAMVVTVSRYSPYSTTARLNILKFFISQSFLITFSF